MTKLSPDFDPGPGPGRDKLAGSCRPERQYPGSYMYGPCEIT